MGFIMVRVGATGVRLACCAEVDLDCKTVFPCRREATTADGAVVGTLASSRAATDPFARGVVRGFVASGADGVATEVRRDDFTFGRGVRTDEVGFDEAEGFGVDRLAGGDEDISLDEMAARVAEGVTVKASLRFESG